MAEEGRLELPRRITPTYKFSKLAPSPTWVLLHIKLSGLPPEPEVWTVLSSPPERFTGSLRLSINNQEMTVYPNLTDLVPPTIAILS